jgi:hypothetical protein
MFRHHVAGNLIQPTATFALRLFGASDELPFTGGYAAAAWFGFQPAFIRYSR